MNLEKIKLLALDLDGTTLCSDTTLLPKVRQALQTAVKNNIVVVAASGRPFCSMPKNVMSIDGVDYAVTSNGSAVYDKNGKRIVENLLDKNDVEALLEITKNYDLIYDAFINGKTYTDVRYTDNPEKYGCPAAYVDYVRSSHGRVDDMRRFICEHSSELDSMEFVCRSKELRTKLWNEIEKNISGLYITSSSENFVEFSAKEATKANGLSFLCRHLGINQKNVAACGNADNDADMICWAGLGAAVKNASKNCIDCADIVVDTNDNGGVAHLVDYILQCNNT